MKKPILHILTITFLSFLFLSTNTIAQLKVMLSEGNNFYQTASNEWSEIAVNQSLDDSLKIKVSNNSLLVLFDKNKRIKEIESDDEDQIFSVKNLSSNMAANNNFLTDFFQNIIDQITDEEKEFTDTIPGAVVRSGFGLSINSPKANTILDNKVTFSWFDVLDSGDYLLTIKNLENDTIANLNINQSSYTLNLDALNLEKDVCYFWRVSSKANPNLGSEEYCIKIMNDFDKEKLNGELKNITDYFKDTPNGLMKTLSIAKYYEKNGLTDKAYKLYHDFYKSNVKYDGFTKEYKQFLFAHGYKTELQNLDD